MLLQHRGGVKLRQVPQQQLLSDRAGSSQYGRKHNPVQSFLIQPELQSGTNTRGSLHRVHLLVTLAS